MTKRNNKKNQSQNFIKTQKLVGVRIHFVYTLRVRSYALSTYHLKPYLILNTTIKGTTIHAQLSKTFQNTCRR